MTLSLDARSMLSQAGRFLPAAVSLAYPSEEEARDLSAQALALDFSAVRRVVCLNAGLPVPTSDSHFRVREILADAEKRLRML